MPPNNARKVSGRKGRVELVEQKVVEDGPDRTISLWRERVAHSSNGSRIADDIQSEADSHSHRRIHSGDSQKRRTVSDGQIKNYNPVEKGAGRRGMEISRTGRASYERSEVSWC